MGYTDGSNAVATCVTAKAMPPHFAVYLSAVVQFVTVVIMYFVIKDMSVAATIGKGLIKSTAYADLSSKKAFLYLYTLHILSVFGSANNFSITSLFS